MSYLYDLFFIFIFMFTNILLLIFQYMYRYFCMTAQMKNVNNFHITKFSLKVLLSICLVFVQFQPIVGYKSVVYKKTCSFPSYFLYPPQYFVYVTFFKEKQQKKMCLLSKISIFFFQNSTSLNIFNPLDKKLITYGSVIFNDGEYQSI